MKQQMKQGQKTIQKSENLRTIKQKKENKNIGNNIGNKKSSSTLIIYTHPRREGRFTPTILEEVTKHLKARGEKIILLDLYKSKFNPVLTKEELGTRINKYVSPNTRKMQDLITSADKLIFLYPTWWQNMPAILKGFIDKVFIEGFAFTYQGRSSKGLPKLLPKGKKAVIITSTGAPNWVTRCVYKQRVIKLLKHDVLKFCGIKAKGYLVGEAQDIKKYDKRSIRKVVKKATTWLYK